MSALTPLLGRTLVLVAHPDDEALGCGALLQRMREAIVLFATDGAPLDSYWWHAYGSRENYAATRRAEAQRAIELCGVRQLEFLSDYEPACVDQELFRHLDRAYAALVALARRLAPHAVLAMSYEGGHPDHDSTSVLACVLGRELNLPVWEMPLYSRTHAGEVSLQTFNGDQATMVLAPTEQELERKRAMFAAYISQKLVIEKFNWREESFRRQPAYDYAQPPHPGKLNYELWEWPMTGSEVSAAFAKFLTNAARPKIQEAGRV
jgi:LmbE family N-acetylglucosaminyl deacetylase